MEIIKEIKKFINIFTRNRKFYPVLNIVRVGTNDFYYELYTLTHDNVDKCIIFKSKFLSDVTADITIINMSEVNEVVDSCTFFYSDKDTKFIYDY